MPFDIHQNLYGSGWFIDEELAETYKQQLLELFEKSPEWKQLQPHADDPAPLWSGMFLDMTLLHIGQPLLFANSTMMREILYELVPEFVLAAPEEAAGIIHELKAFWEFLKREYALSYADGCLKVLNQKTLLRRLEKEMADPANFGPTKSLMMQALDNGVDITDEASMNQFAEQYHRQSSTEPDTASAPLPQAIQQKLDEIIAIATPLCHQHLNQEYADLSQKLADELARLHPSPLERGRARTWAAGIVYAIGRVNYLFDPAQTPHLKADELCALFGVSQTTASASARNIVDKLKMFQLHPEWALPRKSETNPLTWMLAVDGKIIDIRNAPRDVQEEAFQQGLIPYIPADREEADQGKTGDRRGGNQK